MPVFKGKPKNQKRAQTAKGKGNRGGARPGAGRKASALLIAKRVLVEAKSAEADYAFGLLCSYMRAAPPEGQPELMGMAEFRKSCAVEVMNQVWGKPMPRVPEGVRAVLLVVPSD